MLPSMLFTFIILTFTLLISAWGVYRWRKGFGLPLLTMIIFLATIAPPIPLSWGKTSLPVAERYLYTPSLALVIAFAGLYAYSSKYPGFHKTVAAAGLGLTVLFSIQTFLHNDVWQNEIVFWEDVITNKGSAQLGFTWLNLGNAYQNSGNEDKALQSYLTGLENNIISSSETRSKLFERVGNIYLNIAQSREIRSNPNKLLEYSEKAEDAYRNTGILKDERKVIVQFYLAYTIMLGQEAKRKMGKPYDLNAVKEARTYLITARDYFQRTNNANLNGCRILLVQTGEILSR
jgi:tetratricopeptide (TPR) repeat protein